MAAQTNKKTYPSPDPLSLLITEVLFDPEPTVGLPAYEYIELFNRDRDTVDILNWSIIVGEKEVVLSSYYLAPGNFVVLSGLAGAQEFFDRNLPVLPVEKWATLRNSGQFLALLSPKGDIIHFMTYHPAQFVDGLKQEGGWSLELADMDHPCRPEAWLPSLDFNGGTPGRGNSMCVTIMDSSPPLLSRVGVQDEGQLVVILDKPVLPLTTRDWFSFMIEPSILSIESWKYKDNQPWMIEIVLSGSIPHDRRFSLFVGGEAADCTGAGLVSGKVEFGMPEIPDSGDVVISEIMFDPDDKQAEFLGIHNLSGKILALNRLYIAISDEEGVINRFSKPVTESFLMFPGQEYVLTSDKYLFSRMDARIPSGRICERSDMPALSNQGSILCLMDENQRLLDKVRYDPSWHDPRLNETKGISLERIRLDITGLFSSNWHSASAVSGGSTPGSLNSQRSVISDDPAVFSLENRVFCPNQDGSGDYLLIRVATGEPGWIGSAGVWDLSGNSVKVLSEPGALPVTGVIKWDGSDKLGNQVPAGYYVVILNFIRANGSKGRWKEACVVIAY